MTARPNYLASAEAAKVGDFATKSIGGDSYPVEIIARTAKTITVRDAAVVRSSGSAYSESSDNGNFVCIPQENGRTFVFRQSRKTGYFIYSESFFLNFDTVTDRRDPSF